jgi:hypothetical protein
MTAISAVASPRPGQIDQQLFDQQLLGHLREVHARWLQVVRDVLKAARPADAGTWTRWSAIRYVNTVFSIRFERERAAVDSLHQELEASQRARLWAAAELIAALCWQLDHLVGACHHAAEFATVTLKLEGAIEHWCREVEAALGQLTWSEVPEKSRQLLVCIDHQEDFHGT